MSRIRTDHQNYVWYQRDILSNEEEYPAKIPEHRRTSVGSCLLSTIVVVIQEIRDACISV